MFERKDSVAATLRLCGSIEPGSVSAAQRKVTARALPAITAHNTAIATSAILSLVMSWSSREYAPARVPTPARMIADTQIACNDESRADGSSSMARKALTARRATRAAVPPDEGVLGRRVAALRRARSLTLRALSQRSGISESMLSRL